MQISVRRLLVSDADLGNLKQSLAVARKLLSTNYHHPQSLDDNLKRAFEVTRDQIPGHVIAMNTRVPIHDLDVGRQSIYMLVFPRQADVARNRISVLAPVASVLLGRREGVLRAFRQDTRVLEHRPCNLVAVGIC